MSIVNVYFSFCLQSVLALVALAVTEKSTIIPLGDEGDGDTAMKDNEPARKKAKTEKTHDPRHSVLGLDWNVCLHRSCSLLWLCCVTSLLYSSGSSTVDRFY